MYFNTKLLQSSPIFVFFDLQDLHTFRWWGPHFSTMTYLPSGGDEVAPRGASSSAFSPLLTCIISHWRNACSATSYESMWIFTFFTLIVSTILSPASRASYSATLFVVGKEKCTACSILCHVWLVRTTPAPLAFLDVDLSTCVIQHSFGPLSGFGVSSATKFVSACPFIAFVSMNLTSNSLSSIAHFVRCPNMSRLF